MSVTTEVFGSREEWEAARTTIGGSDASAVMGMNPWMSNQTLWKIKTGKSVKRQSFNSRFIAYGNAVESILRDLFRLDYPECEMHYQPNNLFRNDKYDFAHASLDGWLYDEQKRFGVWEAKTANIQNAQMKRKWADDRLPENYYIQVLHNMFVTDAQFAHLTALLKWDYDGSVFEQVRNYHIERSEVEPDIALLRDAEEEFWKSVKEDKEPALILPEL